MGCGSSSAADDSRSIGNLTENEDEQSRVISVSEYDDHVVPLETKDDGELLHKELMTPRPPKTTKAELIPDLSVLSAIDDFARQNLKNVNMSVANLVEHLLKSAKNDLERVRSIYVWITEHIRYDVDGIHSNDYQTNDIEADSVLRSGCSVSRGYSQLFRALCQDMGLEAKLLCGFGKGYGHDMNSFTLGDDPTHTWNAVLIGSDRRFVDCTWGSGHIDVNKNFKKEFEEGYFLTDPEYMVTSHFPCFHTDEDKNARWQLLETPITLKKFNELLKVEVTAISRCLMFTSHKNRELVIKGSTELIIDSRGDLTNISVKFTDDFGGPVNGCTHIWQDAKTRFKIELIEPHTSMQKGKLKVFGYFDATDIGSIICCYSVTASGHKGKGNIQFPHLCSKWGLSPEILQYGFSESVLSQHQLDIDKGEGSFMLRTFAEVKVKFVLIDCYDVDVKQGTFYRKGKSCFHIQIRCPLDGYYKLLVFVRDGAKYQSKGSILVNNRSDLSSKTPRTFPIMYQTAYDDKVELLQPLSGDLACHREYTFRLESPIVERIMAGDHVFISEDGVYEFKVTLPVKGETFTVYGSKEPSGSLYAYACYNITV